MVLKTNTRSFAWCQNNAEIQKQHKWQAIIVIAIKKRCHFSLEGHSIRSAAMFSQ